jgi:hypothetical protein
MGTEASSMALTLAQPLTDLGGTINLIPSLSTFIYGPFGSFPLISGKLVGIPIPEPTDDAFLAFGLVVLIASCARRKLDLRINSGVAASMRALKQRNSRRS